MTANYDLDTGMTLFGCSNLIVSRVIRRTSAQLTAGTPSANLIPMV